MELVLCYNSPVLLFIISTVPFIGFTPYGNKSTRAFTTIKVNSAKGEKHVYPSRKLLYRSLFRTWWVSLRLRFSAPFLRVLVMHLFHRLCGVRVLFHHVFRHGLDHFVPRRGRQLLFTGAAQ